MMGFHTHSVWTHIVAIDMGLWTLHWGEGTNSLLSIRSSLDGLLAYGIHVFMLLSSITTLPICIVHSSSFLSLLSFNAAELICVRCAFSHTPLKLAGDSPHWDRLAV